MTNFNSNFSSDPIVVASTATEADREWADWARGQTARLFENANDCRSRGLNHTASDTWKQAVVIEAAGIARGVFDYSRGWIQNWLNHEVQSAVLDEQDEAARQTVAWSKTYA